ncbi:DNA repair protein RecO [Urbifossiella limnaea]|uniref:DNA repair protein RecO n=1 Tax=Urbifossiella limnaea TaxID=2528023 RepID=A0A517XTG6_9BACT|nr:DNA repair protein RecO [Urbifossiella limnaea]QDU20791.1 DNA repair protein RecO [Urbifossiella limnaea]
MAAEQALALVVRGTDWSETSRITTLFTREFGKLRGLAKGGRRLKSSFDCSFDLLTVCRVVFLRKAQGGLDLLTEARMEEQFPALRENLAALNAGYYVAELLSDGTQDYDPHPELFDAALDTLRKLGEPGESPVDAVTRFELVWLKELGYRPRLDVCTGCGKAVPGGVTRVWFSPAAGGVVCTPCSPSQPDRRPLTGDALRAIATGVVAEPVRAEVRAVLGQVVSFVLGRRPRMHRFLTDR